MSKSGLDAKYEGRRDDSRLAQYCILLALYNSSYYKREALYFFSNVGLGHLYITQKKYNIFFSTNLLFPLLLPVFISYLFPFLKGSIVSQGLILLSHQSPGCFCVQLSPPCLHGFIIFSNLSGWVVIMGYSSSTANFNLSLATHYWPYFVDKNDRTDTVPIKSAKLYNFI